VSKDIPALPQIPVSLPSQLLERRPDIASAERSVMAANANIGVAKAAYFRPEPEPVGGYSSSTYADWITCQPLLVGRAEAGHDLFDGGQRSAEVDRTVASYDETVAKYRQTVLDGFREVENYWCSSRCWKTGGGQQRSAGAARASRCA
jgi:outer membrane protein TolC